MGLDTVELVMEIEERFDIEILDSTLNINTVGELHQLVSQLYLSKHHKTESSSQKAFQKLKTVLIDEFEFLKQNIELETLTKDIFPESNRIHLWKKVEKKAKLKLPELEYNPTHKKINHALSTGFWVIISLVLMALFLVIFLPPIIWSIFLFSLVVLFCIVLIAHINKNVDTRTIPSFCNTLGQLSTSIVYLNPDMFGNPDETEVFEILRHLISEQSGLDFEEIKPKTTFKEIFPYDYK